MTTCTIHTHPHVKSVTVCRLVVAALICVRVVSQKHTSEVFLSELLLYYMVDYLRLYEKVLGRRWSSLRLGASSRRPEGERDSNKVRSTVWQIKYILALFIIIITTGVSSILGPLCFSLERKRCSRTRQPDLKLPAYLLCCTLPDRQGSATYKEDDDKLKYNDMLLYNYI